jgi:coenzyme F420-0:L-glutamate ligase / coenzyme F420-1:gamma-L-glutamate ligase
MASRELKLIPVRVAGEIKAGDSLAEKILTALAKQKTSLRNGDILVVKHKVVSKAEGQIVELSTVKPSLVSQKWAAQYNLNPQVVELALSQSKRIVRRKRGIMITETHHGFICANSGVDVSNVDGGKHALLLPQDPDNSAARLKLAIKKRSKLNVPVIITDSFGRPWREGLTEVAIGVAGMKPLYDYRRKRDAHGYVLHASIEAVADELACAAGLVCGKLEASPACIVRGFPYQPGQGKARELIRPAKNDLFR